LRAGVRDTILLLREFAWPLFFFILVIVGGGLLYYGLARFSGAPLPSRVEAVYQVLGLTFLQPLEEFPDVWYLQAFYFVMPVVGLAILARGLADFGQLFFNRRARGKEWEMAVASTFRNHVVLIGLGHLGFRVLRELHELGQDVVVIELKPDADLINAGRQMGMPIIQEDGTRSEALLGAGLPVASAIVICTQNDQLNLRIALKARKLNPNIRVVVRIFDDEFAQSLEEQFGFQAISATWVAAPRFAAAAAGVDVTRPISVAGQSLSLVRLDIAAGGRLDGAAVGEVEQMYDVSVVLVRRASDNDFHPAAAARLIAGDVLAVLAGPDQISRLVADSRSLDQRPA
jgi:Trk K+ transport system NAD-binding subunit